MPNSSKYHFHKELNSIVTKEFNFETEFPFISILEYTKALSHNKFVVYEDWWLAKPEIVISKIKLRLGLSNRIFARKTTVKRIDKTQSELFLDKNHIYGSVKSKYKLGLFLKEDLVAVAIFSPQRNLNVGRSTELVRFCSKNGTTIIGGLDKLLKFYEKEFQPDHIMTYVDIDWGNGEAFEKIGFKKTSQRKPIQFCVDKKTGKRTVFNKENTNCELKMWNRGSIKFEKYIKTKEVR